MADDDMPPLEDMEKLVSKIKAVQLEKSSESYLPEDKPEEKPVEVKPVPVKKTKESFGGMKKGFLFGGSGSAPKSKKVTVKKEDGIDYVLKAKEKKESQLVLEDVQREIRAKEEKIAAHRKKWENPELLKKFYTNEKMRKYMADPKCNEAIEFMKINPKEAMLRYQDDPEIQDFLTEFAKILGDQYSFMSDIPKDPWTAEDFEHIDSLPIDEFNEITAQPDVQNFLRVVDTDRELAQRMYNGASARTRASLGKLMMHGYFASNKNKKLAKK